MIIEPEGPSRALLCVSITLLILAWVTVVTRVAIRHKIKYIGADDYSMVGGLVCFMQHLLVWAASMLTEPKILFTVLCTSTIISTYYGVGARDERLTPDLNKQSRKVSHLCATINDGDKLTSTIGS